MNKLNMIAVTPGALTVHDDDDRAAGAGCGITAAVAFVLAVTLAVLAITV